MKVVERLKNQFRYLFTKVINLRDQPIEILLINSLRQYKTEVILLSIPIEKCVLGMFWKLDEKNPFVNSIIHRDYTILASYYQDFQPSNVNELFSMDLQNDYGRMQPYSYVLPWNNFSPDYMLKRREEVAQKENKRQGKEELSLIEGGHTDFGPVSESKLQVEISRIQNLYQSISTHGYIEKAKERDGGIKGYFLLNEGGDWKFYINGGKHRAYVLAALGYKKIPVILNQTIPTIDIRDIDKWEQVVKGYYNRNVAEVIFKRFFDKYEN